MIVPEEIIIDIGDEALSPFCTTVVFIAVKLELKAAEVSACNTHWAQEAPRYAV